MTFFDRSEKDDDDLCRFTHLTDKELWLSIERKPYMNSRS